MSHYSEKNTKLQTSGIHYGVPDEEEEDELCKGDYYGQAKVSKGRKLASTWSPCKWICVVLVVLISLFLVTVVIAGTYGYFWTRRQIKRITVESHLQHHLPIHAAVPSEELEVIKDQAKLFYDQIEAGQEPDQDLSITADEINGIIAHSDFLRGHAYVDISEDDKISVEVSLPTTGLPGGKDRYFVASGHLDIRGSDEIASGALVTVQALSLRPEAGEEMPFLFGQFLVYWLASENTDGHELVVNIQSGKFIDYVVPDDYISKKENLLKPQQVNHHHANHHEDADEEDCKKLMKGIQGFSVKNGTITVHARRGPVDGIYTSKSESDPSTVYGGVRTLKQMSKLFFF